MAIAIDGSTPAIASTTASPLTTASFTPPSGSLLVACISSDSNSGVNPTIGISNSGTAFTWTEQIRESAASGGNSGCAVIFTAPVTVSQSMTVTVTSTSSSTAMDEAVQVYVLTGADTSSPVGATGSGSSVVNHITPTVYTSTVNNSWGFGAFTDWADLGAPTSADVAVTFSGIGTAGAEIRKSAATTPVSTAVTLDYDAPGTAATALNWVAVEIKPAGTTVKTPTVISQYGGFF